MDRADHDTTHPSGYCPKCQMVTLQTTQQHAAGGVKWTCCRCGRWDYRGKNRQRRGRGDCEQEIAGPTT